MSSQTVPLSSGSHPLSGLESEAGSLVEVSAFKGSVGLLVEVSGESPHLIGRGHASFLTRAGELAKTSHLSDGGVDRLDGVDGEEQASPRVGDLLLERVQSGSPVSGGGVLVLNQSADSSDAPDAVKGSLASPDAHAMGHRSLVERLSIPVLLEAVARRHLFAVAVLLAVVTSACTGPMPEGYQPASRATRSSAEWRTST